MAEPPLFSKKIDDLLPPDLASGKARVRSASGRSSEYATYEDVPWFRREPGLAVLILALLFSPVLIAVCVIALTGKVYKNDYDENGKLKVWGLGNKLAGIILLGLQTYAWWRYFV